MFKKIFLIFGLTASIFVHSIANQTVITQDGRPCAVSPYRARDLAFTALLLAASANIQTEKLVLNKKIKDGSFKKDSIKALNFVNKSRKNSSCPRTMGTIKQPDRR